MSEATAHAELRRLTVSEWRQFKHVDLQFHPTLTVLTGANASGKTTLLGILARHFNWRANWLAVPLKRRGGDTAWGADSRRAPGEAGTVGTLQYDLAGDVVDAPLYISGSGQQYGIDILGEQFVPGVYISSHRSLSSYQPLSNLPVTFSPTEVLLQQFVNELFNRWSGGYSNRSPLTQMKEALVSAALYGEGNSAVEANPEAEAVWSGFQEVLRRVLPQSLQFDRLVVRLPDVLIRTRTSDFLLEAMSGGVNAIIELAWQVFLRSRQYDTFTVCIDEPENHLHPSLQRELIPGLIAAFPHIKFIVATHSPFVVTAVPDSNVYVLEYLDESGVVSRLLDTANKAATSDQTLRKVLGLDTTIPLWVESRMEAALSQLPVQGATVEDLRRLREAFVHLGLQEEFPDAVDAIINRNESGAQTD